MDSASLKGKKIILVVSASIAAYKSVVLLRLLVKQGAEVQVILTEAAKAFVGSASFSTLSNKKVLTEFLESENSLWNNHVKLGIWADAFIVAPATASILARMAKGMSNDFAVASYLSARCPVFFAPAMDLDMWKHPATQTNVETLKGYGNYLIPVESGELASGLSGEGRMAEPENIAQYLKDFFAKSTTKEINASLNPDPTKWKGKRILISAGPTREAFDPVRFLSNKSTGKMGIALAEVAAKAGAEVKLVLGPTAVKPKLFSNLEVIDVLSAQDMFDACVNQLNRIDVGIMAAAVSDYRPAKIQNQKMKKKDGDLGVELERTPDILATLGKQKSEDQILVGFALETQNEIENAKSKLKRKNLDFIVLNSLRDKGAGFKHDTNKISILDKYNKVLKFELKTKHDVAKDILIEIQKLF